MQQRGTLTDNSRAILEKRYLEPNETIDGMFRRVSHGNEDYYKLLSSLDYAPNSPTLMNAHTGRKGTLSACFTLYVSDSLLDGSESIMATRSKAASLAKWGGGIGYYLGDIRPKGSLIQSVHRKACGPVAVLKDYNGLDALITQGGKRALAPQIGIPPCVARGHSRVHPRQGW